MDEKDMNEFENINDTAGEQITEAVNTPEPVPVEEAVVEEPVAETAAVELEVVSVPEQGPAEEVPDLGAGPDPLVGAEEPLSYQDTPEQIPPTQDLVSFDTPVTGTGYQAPYYPQEKKKGGYGKWLIIMGAALILTIAYSVIQTVYIYKLNTGLTGVKSYVAGLDDKSGQQTGSSDTAPSDVSADTSYEPWFSLEEANADYKDTAKLSTTEIAKKVSPSTVSILIYEPVNGKDTATSAGSGFIITKDGYIVTNAHVVEDVPGSSKSIKVKAPGVEDPYEAQIIGMDDQTDVAVIKITSDKDLPFVELGNSDLLCAGELVVVIGNALGTLDGTVTVGVISATEREIHNNGYTIPVIQTDAAINSGNSGGPMINSYGQVVGITNAKMVSGTAEGLGFGIPVNKVRSVIESIINYGKVINRPYLGMTLSLVEEGSYYGAEPGVYVTDMIQNGPAVRSGIKVGDQVLSFDGVEISKPSDIIGIRDSHNVGDVVDVVIVRDGVKQTVPLTIGDSGDYEGAGSVSELPDQDQGQNPGGHDGTEPGIPDGSDGTGPTRPAQDPGSDGGDPRGLDIFDD